MRCCDCYFLAAADAARTAFTDADKKREDIQHQIE